NRACWAFYSGVLDRPGIGSRMEAAAIDYAFGELGVEKLWCEVLSTNPKVIALHRKVGFVVEGVFRNHYLIDGAFADVVRLALFRDTWNRYLRGPMQAVVEGKRVMDPTSPGQSHETTILATRERIALFGVLSGDANPIHGDPAAAKEAGFPSPIAHGMLLGALISGVFGTEFPGPGTIYRKQDLHFVAPVFEGESLLARITVLSKIGRTLIANVEVRRSSGDELVAEGEAELLIPRNSS
nr:GNAT family N-acetyltransferase [Gemmatimonadaceae bacterium]